MTEINPSNSKQYYGMNGLEHFLTGFKFWTWLFECNFYDATERIVIK